MEQALVTILRLTRCQSVISSKEDKIHQNNKSYAMKKMLKTGKKQIIQSKCFPLAKSSTLISFLPLLNFFYSLIVSLFSTLTENFLNVAKYKCRGIQKSNDYFQPPSGK